MGECVVKPGLFQACLDRLGEFMIPFVKSFFRVDQENHAKVVVSGLCSDLVSKNAESIAYHFSLNAIRFNTLMGNRIGMTYCFSQGIILS